MTRTQGKGEPDKVTMEENFRGTVRVLARDPSFTLIAQQERAAS
jgi:hypothetical protein